MQASDTAYPRFKTNFSQKDLARYYTPAEEEIAFSNRVVRGVTTRLGLLVLLKAYQRLGYFVTSDEVPELIVRHIAEAIGEPSGPTALRRYDRSRARSTHMRAIRRYLNVRPFTQGGMRVLQPALRAAGSTKEDLADLINVGIETLIRNRFELPAFGTLLREARTQRTAANQALFTDIYHRLGKDGRDFLDALFVTSAKGRTSPWNDLKRDVGKPTVQGLRLLLQRHDQVKALARYDQLLHRVPVVKAAHWPWKAI